jgi:hypothetical protein
MVRLAKTALDPKLSARESTQAARAILEADRINLDAEKNLTLERIVDAVGPRIVVPDVDERPWSDNTQDQESLPGSDRIDVPSHERNNK